MANSQIAFMEQCQVPSRQLLQDAIKSQRFKLTIDDAYVPFESTGYIPCTLDGEDAGFEIKFGSLAAGFADQPHILEKAGGRETVITLRWGGDLRERASAQMISAVLVRDFGALIYRQDEDCFCTTDALFEEVREVFSQLQDL